MREINNKRIFKIILSVIIVISLIIGGFAVYLSDYYHADIAAIEAFSAAMSVTKTAVSDDVIVYGGSESKVGFIFYPGGKVEYKAYESLMMELASKGILCILIEMPFNLAVLDMNAADGIRELYPEIDHWYIGGHSLGGSIAASYAAKNSEYFDGVILLASYSTTDISATTLDALSIYGSEDNVMNREKYEKYKKNLPTDLIEIVIDGGCHAYFGMYGEQDGDGTPTLSADEQIRVSADYISDFVLKGNN